MSKKVALQEPTEQFFGIAAAGEVDVWPGTHLDGLVGPAVQVVLGRHQGPDPVVEARQLLLQLQLGAHNVPDLGGGRTGRKAT